MEKFPLVMVTKLSSAGATCNSTFLKPTEWVLQWLPEGDQLHIMHSKTTMSSHPHRNGQHQEDVTCKVQAGGLLREENDHRGDG